MNGSNTLTYRHAGKQVNGMSSAIALEELGRFELKRATFGKGHILFFTDRATGVTGGVRATPENWERKRRHAYEDCRAKIVHARMAKGGAK